MMTNDYAGAVMEGVPVSLLDTAGVREAGDLVERLGVQRSRAAAQGADIVLMIYDATVPPISFFARI